MKIGFFTDSYRPYTSGVVRSIETFSKELRELGHEIYIFAPNYPKCQPEQGVFRFVSVPSPTYQNFTLAIPISVQLKKTMRHLGIEIVHVHSPFLLGRMGARYARSSGLPLVSTYHTLYDQYVHYVPFAKNLSRRIILKITRDFCNICDLVVSPTAIVANKLDNSGVNSRVAVIPTGIDLQEFAPADRGWLRSQYGLKADDILLLHVGRLSTEKNIEFLFQAFVQIARQEPRARLVLVGTGPLSESLRKQAAEHSIEHRVIFTGLLSREQVINAYTGADLFLLASTTETQGLVLGEAKAAGLPVVALRAFGAMEMVEDGDDGYLVENQETFVERVLEITKNDELRRSLGARALVNVEKISSRACALKLLEEYSQLLQHKKGRRSPIPGCH